MNKENDFDKETVEKAKATVENYLKSNFKDIDTITFEDDYTHPMGGMNVRGTW